jgi:hypothetical protein
MGAHGPEFSHENRLLLHQLAVRWSLNLPAAHAVKSCAVKIGEKMLKFAYS